MTPAIAFILFGMVLFIALLGMIYLLVIGDAE